MYSILKGGIALKRFLKRFKGILILVLLEGFIFFKMENRDNEMFFFVWSIIALVLLLNNIFDINGNKSMTGGIGANGRMMLASMIGTFPWREDNSKKKSNGELYISMNWLYLIFLIANIIGYIIVMPK